MRVLLLDLLKQLHLAHDVALVSGAEYPCKPARVQPVGGIGGIFVIYISDRHYCRDRPALPCIGYRIKGLPFFPFFTSCHQ